MKEKKLKKIFKKEKRLIKKREKEYIAFGKKIQKQFNINRINKAVLMVSIRYAFSYLIPPLYYLLER